MKTYRCVDKKFRDRVISYAICACCVGLAASIVVNIVWSLV
jgi:hypothetical protein